MCIKMDTSTQQINTNLVLRSVHLTTLFWIMNPRQKWLQTKV